MSTTLPYSVVTRSAGDVKTSRRALSGIKMIRRRDKGLLTSLRAKAKAAQRGEAATRVNLRVSPAPFLSHFTPFPLFFPPLSSPLVLRCSLSRARAVLTFIHRDRHCKHARGESHLPRETSIPIVNGTFNAERDYFSPLFSRGGIKILRCAARTRARTSAGFST